MIKVVRKSNRKDLSSKEEKSLAALYRMAFDEELNALEAKGLATTLRYAPVWIRALCVTKIIHTEKSTVYNVEYWDGRPAWLGKFYESLGFRIHGSRDHRQAVRYIQCSYQKVLSSTNSPSPRK
eukprot:g6736.t1